jgi:SAM-dependent methyltransferase
MIRYVSAAVALKCFSATPLTRSIYRALANQVGNKQRSTGAIPGYYVDRITRMLRLAREQSIVRDGDRILELGTGWLHWEALTIRLFWDVSAVLFDVWDNRQLDGLKNYCRQLVPIVERDLDLTSLQRARANVMLSEIQQASSFDELYELLNFEYVVESAGSLAQFPEGRFQLVVSGGVLEHVNRDGVPELVRQSFRVLSPGGVALHSIDTSDHLSHYDPSVSKKLYLRISEPTWMRFLENRVQYINRVQRSEWLALFQSTGFDIIDEDSREVDVSDLNVAPRYSHVPKHDLACTVLRVAMRKPAGGMTIG